MLQHVTVRKVIITLRRKINASHVLINVKLVNIRINASVVHHIEKVYQNVNLVNLDTPKLMRLV